MTKCTNCTRPAELFLCGKCQSELRQMLRDLPGWITALEEAAWGQTRLGESVRRSTDKTGPMLCNLDASELLNYTRSVLVEWVRDICEQRGITTPSFDPVRAAEPSKGSVWIEGTGELSSMALWLSQHVSALASDEGAAVAYREFKQILTDIEHRVDRPRSPLFVGQCPTMLTVGYGQQRCPAQLVIPPEAKLVQCRECKATFEVAELIEQRLGEASDLLFIASDTMVIMDMLLTPVAESTWRRWRAQGDVQPAGELYGEPAYRIQDVREFRRRWTRRKAG